MSSIIKILILIVLSITTSPSFAGSYNNKSYVVFDYTLQNQTQTQQLSLLRWNSIKKERPQPQDPYERDFHFGDWTNDPTDHLCQNTRAKVLIEESLVAVRFRSKNSCVVDQGRWKDPYTNNIYTDAAELQVDHFVPLKNAYISGAYQWTYKKRCTYANFLHAPFHLLAVDAQENMIKSDQAPHLYMPPNEEYHCTYLKNWLKVKYIWELNMSDAEARFISREINKNCHYQDFTITKSELKKYKSAMLQYDTICKDNPTTPPIQ